MKYKLHKSIVIYTLFQIQILFAQTDSNQVASILEQNRSTLQLNSNLQYGFEKEKFSINFNDRYYSSVIKSYYKTFRSENNFDAVAILFLSDEVKYKILANSYLLSEGQNLTAKRNGWHNLFFGSDLNYFDKIKISPLVGVRSEEQSQKTENGFAGKISFAAKNFEVADGNANIIFDFTGSKPGKREHWNKSWSSSYFNNFSNAASDSLIANWNNNRWDFYQPSDNFIIEKFGEELNTRERTDEKYFINNYLNFKMSENINSIINFNYINETIGNNYRLKLENKNNLFDTEFKKEQFEILSRFDLQFKKMNGYFYIRHSERDERHEVIGNNLVDKNLLEQKSKQESKLNSLTKTTQISTFIENGKNEKLNFGVDFSAQILRYDTPDTTNIEDRDEFSSNISFFVKNKFSEDLNVGVGGDLILHHLVYLFNERSANNNWNRVIRFWSEAGGSGENYRHKIRGEVLANYTVFDFETISPFIKSYIYRELNWKDSTTIKIYKNNWFNFFAEARFYERGDLNWKEFKERPIQYFEEYTFNPSLSFFETDEMKLLFGIRSFIQKKYSYNKLAKIFDERFSSFGPTVNFNYQINADGVVNLKIWFEEQSTSKNYLRNFTNGSLELKWIL